MKYTIANLLAFTFIAACWLLLYSHVRPEITGLNRIIGASASFSLISFMPAMILGAIFDIQGRYR